MSKKKLEELTREELVQKEKSTKVLLGLFIPIILALAYFGFRDYQKTNEFSSFDSIIIICTIGGMASLFPILRATQNELEKRN